MLQTKDLEIFIVARVIAEEDNTFSGVLTAYATNGVLLENYTHNDGFSDEGSVPQPAPEDVAAFRADLEYRYPGSKIHNRVWG
jgi:hypothetical protein